MKFTTSILAVAFIAVPALAASYDDYEQYGRSLTDIDADVYERAFDATADDIVVTREDLEELFGREFIADIEERSPFGLGLIFKGIKAAVKIGKAAHHAHEAKKNHHRREFIEDEDLELREFEEDDLLERENFDDLD